MHVLSRLGPLVLCAAFAAGAWGCRRQKHERVASFTAPPLRAGFVERSGNGWRLSVPSTWRDAPQSDAGAWAVVDPQAADDFHAKVFVVTEPFAGESYDYAKASEAGLRRERRASVDPPHEDVVDGDPTLVLESYWAPAASTPGAVAYRTMQTALASRGTGYVVTCSVSSSAFDRYRSTCESILRSFAVER